MEDSESLDCPIHGKPVVDFVDTLDGARVVFECGCKGSFTPDGLVELDSDSLAKVIPIRPEVVVGSKRIKQGDAVLWKKQLWRVEYLYNKENKGNVMLSNTASGDKMAPLDELEYVAKDTLSSNYSYQEPWDSQFRRSSTSSTPSQGSHKPSRYFGGAAVEKKSKPQPPPPADSIDTASLIQSEVRRLEQEDKETKADTRKLVTKPPTAPTPPASEEPTPPLPKRRGDW